MQMTDIEIVSRYRRAENKKEQLSILAQLNACDEDDIKKILLQGGLTEEDLPKKRGRKPGNKETKKMPEEKVVVDETKEAEREALAEMLEIPELTPEEENQVDRALAIPEPVRTACVVRVSVLTDKIIELEKERNCIQDYLEGVSDNG